MNEGCPNNIEYPLVIWPHNIFFILIEMIDSTIVENYLQYKQMSFLFLSYS